MKTKIRYNKDCGLFKKQECEGFLLGFSASYMGTEKAWIMDKDGNVFFCAIKDIIKAWFVQSGKNKK